MKRVWQVSVCAALVMMLSVLVPNGAASAAGAWSYQRTVTIDSSQVASDLPDFPVLLSLSGDWLKDVVHGGHVTQPDGGDILFTSTDYTKLDHQVEAYDAANGTLVAWVRIPLLSGSTDYEFLMLYGNPDAPDQWNSAAVWDEDFVMVQHLHETSSTHFDSTAYGNDGIPQGGLVQDAVGILDGADDFDGVDARVDCGTGLSQWSDQAYGQQRAVIKGGKIYVTGGGTRPTPFSAYVFIFDLVTGDLLQQSPALSDTLDFTGSETAPVVDGDMIYAVPTKGNIHAWDTLSNTFVWTTTQLSTWSSRIEHDGSYLYATTADYRVVKVDTSDGTVVQTFNLDPDTDNENAVSPYLDQANGFVYAMGASNLYQLSTSTLSEIWRRPIGSGCLDTGSDHSRMTPIMVNDANTGNEPWLIAGCWGDDNYYAYDQSGNLEWTIPITEGVRSPASYDPNNGYLYIPSQGDTIYVRNIADGSEVFTIASTDIPDGSQFDKPITIVHSNTQDYMIFKTTGGSPRYIYVFDATTGNYLTRFSLGDDTLLTEFPIAVSQGYLVTGGSIVSLGGQDGGLYAVKAGSGDPVDYYPLHGPYRYGYIEHALTDLESFSLNPKDAITLEAWANLRELTTGMNDHLVCREGTYCLEFAQETAGDAPRFRLYGTEGQWHNLDLADSLNPDEWYYLAGTWISPTISLYVNGSLTGTLPFTGTMPSSDTPTLIGAYGGTAPNQAPDGRIDEVRISSVARSPEWIATSYNNQSSPSTFYTLGPELQPGISLDKAQTGTPTPPGAEVPFTIAVTNTGDLDLAVVNVVDPAVPGCNRSLGSLLAGGSTSYDCSAPNVTAEFTNTATVSATVWAQMYLSATDSVSVDLLPSIEVTKTVDPEILLAPGGTVTFSLAFDNTCTEPLTITSLVDSVHGDLNGQGTCLVPSRLDPLSTHTCAFTATIIGDGGYQEIDEITAWVSDDEGNSVSDSDTATVTLITPTNILVEPTALTVSEPSSSDSFRLSLVTEPGAPVTIPLSLSNNQCTVTLASAVLDSNNWSLGIDVTAAAVDDQIDDDDQLCNVLTEPSNSLDPDYHGLDAEDVAVTVLDDDEAGFGITPTELEISEPAGSDDFVIRLETEPLAAVSIDLSPSNDECAVSPSPVVLESNNWDDGVAVTVTARDDDEQDGQQVCVVQTDPAESADLKYNGLDPADVSVTVYDDEHPVWVYLPLVLSGWPPVPALEPLASPDCDGQYSVSWSAIAAAEAYDLQEASDCTFSNPVQVYHGSDTSLTINDQAEGQYCYRVRALGMGWTGPWSSAQAVDVFDIPAAPVLSPIPNTDGDGNYDIVWNTVDMATTYDLTEARGDACSEPLAAYLGPDTSHGVSGKGAGRFCYYVRAANDCGQSGWSNRQWVNVLWEAEPNSLLSQANGPLAAGPVYRGTLVQGDTQDYFYVDLDTDLRVELWLYDIPAGQDYDLYLRNEQGTVLGISNSYGSLDEHISTAVLPPGKYFIQVHHFSPGGSAEAYRLRVDFP